MMDMIMIMILIMIDHDDDYVDDDDDDDGDDDDDDGDGDDDDDNAHDNNLFSFQNLTPAHKLMRNRSSRPRDEPSNSNNALEDQCEQLRQQLSNSTAFSTTLLRNQQTLLTMLQNQFATMNDARSFGKPNTFNLIAESLGFYSFL